MISINVFLSLTIPSRSPPFEAVCLSIPAKSINVDRISNRHICTGNRKSRIGSDSKWGEGGEFLLDRWRECESWIAFFFRRSQNNRRFQSRPTYQETAISKSLKKKFRSNFISHLHSTPPPLPFSLSCFFIPSLFYISITKASSYLVFHCPISFKS